jgi:hypothetical protein
LTDAVPGTDVLVSLTVDDGANRVTRETHVFVDPPEAGRDLFPADEMAEFDGWERKKHPNGFVLYLPRVVTGDCRDEECVMSMLLPEGGFWFTGAIEAVADFKEEAPTGTAGVRLCSADGRTTTLSYRGGTSAQCVVAPDAAGASVAGSSLTRELSGLPGGKLYVSIRAEESIRIVFGSRSQWQSLEVPRSDARLTLEIFGREGLTRFHAFRLQP